MDQNRQVKTSANFDKIPEVINVSLMHNDTDSTLCPGPLGSSACPACSDIEVYITAFQRHWDNILKGSGDIPISCVAVGVHEDQDEDCAEAKAEEHEEEVAELDTIQDFNEESSDDMARRSVVDYEEFSAFHDRFKEFSKKLESTKKRVAEIKKNPKEPSRDIIDELEKATISLEKEVYVQCKELRSFKDYLKKIYDKGFIRIKRLETYIEDSGQDCEDESSDDVGSDETPSCVAVGAQDDQDKGSLYEQRDPIDCAEAEAEEHNEEMSAYSTKEVPELDTICDDMAHDSIESIKKFFAEVVITRFKELKRDIEDEHERGHNDELEELQTLVIKEKSMDHKWIKFRESLDIQEDGLMSTSWPMRYSPSHEEIEVPIKLLAARSRNPSKARVKKSYAEMLELDEAMDHERITAMTSKDSVERTELSRASESAWVRRESPFKKNKKFPVMTSEFRSAKSMRRKFRDRGMETSSGNSHWPGIGPGVESPRGCCGPGRRLPHRTDVFSVQVDLVSSSTGTSEVMTIRPNVEDESKDNERIKFRECLNTQDDSIALTREWLVRHAHSQEEISLPKTSTSPDLSPEIYNIYTNNLISSLMSGIVRRRGGDRQQ